MDISHLDFLLEKLYHDKDLRFKQTELEIILESNFQADVINSKTIVQKLLKDGLIAQGEDYSGFGPYIEAHVVFFISFEGVQFFEEGGYQGQKRRNDDRIRFEERKMQLEQQQIESNLVTNILARRNVYWSIGLASLSVIFIAVSAFLQWRDETATEVRELKLQMQKTSASLDSIARSLNEMNSAFKTQLDLREAKIQK